MENLDNKIILTLDAGGTNFVFSAMKGGEFITDEIVLPSNATNLKLCLDTMVEGFEKIMDKLSESPVAISFAFPGPADYPNGIIGGFLPNFPEFRDGVALKDFLQMKLNLPVYINNDADLYAYGEAIGGILPEVNAKLKEYGSPKQYKNLLGYTVGTGFGFGFVSNNNLHIGDNSCVETYCLPSCDDPEYILEDDISIRGVKRMYGELSGDTNHKYEPKDIFEIAEGTLPGDQKAAREAFAKLGAIAGDAIATSVSLIDGIVVIGGGIMNARKYIMPSLLEVLRSSISTRSGEKVNRVQMKVYNLDDDREFKEFASSSVEKLKVFGTDIEVDYDKEKRIGVCTSKIGTSKAIFLGAAAYALNHLE